MLLSRVVSASAEVAATPARLGKVDRLAAVLAELAPDEVAIGVAYLSGELTQRQIGVGWATLREAPEPATEPVLTLVEVDATLGKIGTQAGAGSQAARRTLLAELLARATADEQWFLRRLIAGELRQGALAGVMVDAVARAAGLPGSDVRRALMLRGELGPVAATALDPGPAGGAAGLAAYHLEVGRPVLPMLATPADGIEAAFEKAGPADTGGLVAVEWKLDGARIQVHRAGADVRVFTRSLDEITARLPEVVALVRDLPASRLVLDGEVIALRPDGRPEPFQVTASRVGTRAGGRAPSATAPARRDSTPLHAFFFDVLHRDGVDLIDAPGIERVVALAEVVPTEHRVPRIVTDSPAEAADFFAGALARGHEGVLVKSLTGPYEAGRRGAGWLKVKPRHTLDLVVLAAEWGHGRRRGWLSNLHLGARDPDTGGFVMLGKTFKGLTDEVLGWQTERLTALAVESNDWVVTVRPELVVEVAFDGVQTSPRYPGKVALRFARVLRYREDKSAAEADTIDTVRAIHAGRPHNG
jgi:ATP-dependent DNA ligase I